MKEGKEFHIPTWFWPTNLSPLAGDLLVKLLQVDPSQRITAAEAMRHPWCRSTADSSLPCSPVANNGGVVSTVELSSAMSISAPDDQQPSENALPLDSMMSISSPDAQHVQRSGSNSSSSINRTLFVEQSTQSQFFHVSAQQQIQQQQHQSQNRTPPVRPLLSAEHFSSQPLPPSLLAQQQQHLQQQQSSQQHPPPPPLTSSGGSGGGNCNREQGWGYNQAFILEQQRQKEAEALESYARTAVHAAARMREELSPATAILGSPAASNNYLSAHAQDEHQRAFFNHQHQQQDINRDER